MNCMKCGREVESEQVFCEACLLEMKKYPVSPNAAVHLPIRPKSASARKAQSRRRGVSPEEQVKVLKKRVWVLAGALTVSIVLILALLHPAVNYFLKNYHLRPGQNYTTVVSTTVPVETTEETQG